MINTWHHLHCFHYEKSVARSLSLQCVNLTSWDFLAIYPTLKHFFTSSLFAFRAQVTVLQQCPTCVLWCLHCHPAESWHRLMTHVAIWSCHFRFTFRWNPSEDSVSTSHVLSMWDSLYEEDIIKHGHPPGSLCGNASPSLTQHVCIATIQYVFVWH